MCHYKTEDVAFTVWLSRDVSTCAKLHLFAGILQASIRTNDHVSAALDWLFARQPCDRHRNLQVRTGDTKSSTLAQSHNMASCLLNGDFILEAIKWRRSTRRTLTFNLEPQQALTLQVSEESPVHHTVYCTEIPKLSNEVTGTLNAETKLTVCNSL